jgi:hypothetical protein
MRQLIYECECGMPSEKRFDVHLLESRPAVINDAARNDLEIADPRFGLRATVTFDETDDNVGTPSSATLPLVKHRKRLPDSGRGAEIDAKVPRWLDDLGDI